MTTHTLELIFSKLEFVVNGWFMQRGSHIEKISVDITSVGLAHARPNYKHHINIHTYLNALLLSDFSSDRDAGPQVQDWHELREGAQKAAVAHRLCVLTEHIARAEICDDACTGERTGRDS